MANYQEHKSTGLGWWLIISLGILVGYEHLGLNQAESLLLIGVGLPAALLGAGFPDIDLASSIPHRRFRFALLCLTTLMCAGPLLSPTAQEALKAALAELGLLTAYAPAAGSALALLLGLVAVALLAIFLPRHRGLTHRWPFGFTIALILAVLVYASLGTFTPSGRTQLLSAISTGTYFLLGFASHLFKDGILFRSSKRR